MDRIDYYFNAALAAPGQIRHTIDYCRVMKDTLPAQFMIQAGSRCWNWIRAYKAHKDNKGLLRNQFETLPDGFQEQMQRSTEEIIFTCNQHLITAHWYSQAAIARLINPLSRALPFLPPSLRLSLIGADIAAIISGSYFLAASNTPASLLTWGQRRVKHLNNFSTAFFIGMTTAQMVAYTIQCHHDCKTGSFFDNMGCYGTTIGNATASPQGLLNLGWKVGYTLQAYAIGRYCWVYRRQIADNVIFCVKKSCAILSDQINLRLGGRK